MKADLTGGKHGAGVLCDASGCCQGYVSTEEYLAGGGTPENLEKVKAAVMETDSLVLEYEGELIEAVYFSSSGGKTEAAVAVWGAEFPYLQSVDSPGEEGARYHTDSLLIPSGEFSRLLGLELPEDSAVWFGAVKYTEGGGVETMEIAGKTFSGTELRALLGLRSTAFTMEPAGEYIRIATRGYGHRVGMSQYGANAMALTGHTWQQILQHYYPGTVIVPAA
jgi:stage II sporulation protein D